MDTPEIEAGRNLVRQIMVVSRRWRARLDDRLRDLGVSEPRFAALLWLSREPEGLSQTALAEQAGVEPATLVRVIDALEKDGLVERCPCPHDRRVKILRLTPEAVPFVKQIDGIGLQLGAEIMDGIDLEQLVAASSVLDAVRARLDAI